MTGTALLMALVVVLQFLGGSIPPVGGFTISLVLIPIVLGAALYGPKTGGLLGTVFGIVVVIGCITGTDVGGAMVFQANPVLCILVVLGKGILAGSASGLVYGALKNRSPVLAMMLASAVCPVVNTGIFLIGGTVFFLDTLTEWGKSFGYDNVAAYMFFGLVGFNFLFELGLNIVLSPMVVRLLNYKKKK